MKIQELEDNFDTFSALSNTIGELLKVKAYDQVFDACRHSLDSLIPYLKFRKKRKIEPDYPELTCVEVVCKYAPAFFEKKIIDDFYQYFKGNRILSKNYATPMAELAASRDLVAVAKQIWDGIAEQSGLHIEEITADIVDDDAAGLILDIWSEANVIYSKTEQESHYSFVTQMDEMMIAVCSHCGVKGRAAKIKLLKPNKCPKCKSKDYFHMIASGAM